MKQLFKNPTTKKLTYLMFFLLGAYLLIDAKNLYIDFYNFRQLSQVIQVLDTAPDKNYNFFGPKEFNARYIQNIQPIKNCYFIADRNQFFPRNEGGGGYVMGFKIESYALRLIYWDEYKIYPKYDLPLQEVCSSYCSDAMYDFFIKTISNPCKE